MDLDPEVFKQIIETFKVELEEKLQSITDCLLKLEKINKNEDEFAKIIEEIFRSSHNIKGAARGVGLNNIADIAHHIESLFTSIKQGTMQISSYLIDLCFEAVDAMRFAMVAYTEKKSLPFDLSALLKRLETGDTDQPKEKKTVKRGKVKHNLKKEAKADAIIPIDEQPLSELETIRVSLKNLDKISAMMEEIQANKIAIDDNYSELTKLFVKTKKFTQLWKQTQNGIKTNLKGEINDNLQKLLSFNSDSISEINNSTEQLNKNMRKRIYELNILSNSLQEEIRMMRLIPASTLLCTFPRIVRDLANEMNKKIEFEIKGDDVKIDKLVLEGLKDPLIHLLRNAIDHGIESPDLRKLHDKPEAGKIFIEFHEEGNQILIQIKDDGNGIDTHKVAEIAEKQNLISQSELENMNENDILDLLFRPGFSTKEIITSVSGRGIGLDVVKSNLSSLKGKVGVETAVGKGTIFNLRVPLTLASERGLVFISGSQLLVIPTNEVERVLAIDPKEIVDVEGTQAILLDKKTIPLCSLSHILDFEQTEPDLPNRLPIIIVKKGWKTVAFIVDEIIGDREIVIKSFNPPLNSLLSAAGGTLAGNGEIIIVLNTSDLINKALQGGKNSRVIIKDKNTEVQVRPNILVVDDSITTRSLEKNILESKDYIVTVAVDGKEAWDILQKQKFSLLITDIAMPNMDGFTLTERIKKSPSHQDLPVIIVTSLDSEAEKKRGIEVGADAYIVKNEFESNTLLEIVAQLI